MVKISSLQQYKACQSRKPLQVYRLVLLLFIVYDLFKEGRASPSGYSGTIESLDHFESKKLQHSEPKKIESLIRNQDDDQRDVYEDRRPRLIEFRDEQDFNRRLRIKEDVGNYYGNVRSSRHQNESWHRKYYDYLTQHSKSKHRTENDQFLTSSDSFFELNYRKEPNLNDNWNGYNKAKNQDSFDIYGNFDENINRKSYEYEALQPQIRDLADKSFFQEAKFDESEYTLNLPPRKKNYEVKQNFHQSNKPGISIRTNSQNFQGARSKAFERGIDGKNSHNGDPRYHAFHQHLYEVNNQKVKLREVPTLQPIINRNLKPKPRPSPIPSSFLSKPVDSPRYDLGKTHGGDARYHAFHRHLYEVNDYNKTPAQEPETKRRPILKPRSKQPVKAIPEPNFGSKETHGGDPRYHAFHRHLYEINRPKTRPTVKIKPTFKPIPKPVPIQPVKPRIKTTFKPILTPKPNIAPKKTHGGDPRYHAFHRYLYEINNPKIRQKEKPKIKTTLRPTPLSTPRIRVKSRPTPRAIIKPPRSNGNSGKTHGGDPRYHAFHRHLYEINNPRERSTKRPVLQTTIRPTLKPITRKTVKPKIRLPEPTARPTTKPVKSNTETRRTHGGDPRFHAFHRHLYEINNPRERSTKRPVLQTTIRPTRKPITRKTVKPRIRLSKPTARPNTKTRKTHGGDPRFHAFHRHLYEINNPKVQPTLKPEIKIIKKPIFKPTIRQTMKPRIRITKPIVLPKLNTGPKKTHGGDPRYHAFHRHLYEINKPKATPTQKPKIKELFIPKVKKPLRPKQIPKSPAKFVTPDTGIKKTHGGDPKYHAFHKHLFEINNPKRKTLQPELKTVFKPTFRPVINLSLKPKIDRSIPTLKPPKFSQKKTHGGDPKYHAFHRHLYEINNSDRKPTPKPELKKQYEPILTPILKDVRVSNDGGKTHGGNPRFHAFHRHLY